MSEEDEDDVAELSPKEALARARELAQSESLRSVETLVALRDYARGEGVKLAAARALTDMASVKELSAAPAAAAIPDALAAAIAGMFSGVLKSFSGKAAPVTVRKQKEGNSEEEGGEKDVTPRAEVLAKRRAQRGAQPSLEDDHHAFDD